MFLSCSNCKLQDGRNPSGIYKLSSQPWSRQSGVSALGVHSLGGESGSPQMVMDDNHEHTSYTYNSVDRRKRERRRHLQCEAGRARVPMGQLVRQFGSGQTGRERREKQVRWKVCFKQKNSTSRVPALRRPPGENGGPRVHSEAGRVRAGGGGHGTQPTGLSPAMCQQTEEGRTRDRQWPPNSLTARNVSGVVVCLDTQPGLFCSPQATPACARMYPSPLSSGREGCQIALLAHLCLCCQASRERGQGHLRGEREAQKGRFLSLMC